MRGRTLVVLERLGDADNVGSTFRSAAAFGVDGVLLGPACADPLYRKAIRTSMGAALSIPFAHVDTATQPWPAAMHTLRDSGWHEPNMVAADNLSAQKAAVLLSLALAKTSEPDEIQRIFNEY